MERETKERFEGDFAFEIRRLKGKKMCIFTAKGLFFALISTF